MIFSSICWTLVSWSEAAFQDGLACHGCELWDAPERRQRWSDLKKTQWRGGRVDIIRVVSHGCLWFYVMSVFFWFAFVWEVLIVGVLGKTNFKKKSWGEFSSSSFGKNNCSFCFSDTFMGRGEGCRWPGRTVSHEEYPGYQGLALIDTPPKTNSWNSNMEVWFRWFSLSIRDDFHVPLCVFGGV